MKLLRTVWLMIEIDIITPNHISPVISLCILLYTNQKAATMYTNKSPLNFC